MNSREILIQSRRPPCAPPGVRSPRTSLGAPLPPLGALRSRFIIAAALAVVVLAGCDYFLTTSLKSVQADPLKYEGKPVTLKGTVAEVTQLPLINVTTYTLQDGNAKIVIFTKAPLPKVKETIKVKGTVKSTMIVNGKSVGQHMQEIERLK